MAELKQNDQVDKKEESIEENETEKDSSKSYQVIGTPKPSSKTEESEEEEEDFEDNPEVVELKENLKTLSAEQIKEKQEELRKEISHLSSGIKDLKKRRGEYNAQARHYRAMRDNQNKIQGNTRDELYQQAQEAKELRDKCNEEIQQLKERRENLVSLKQSAWEKVKKKQEKQSGFREEYGFIPKDIDERIEELEWKQQTESLPPKEHTEITEELKDLYQKKQKAQIISSTSSSVDSAVTKAKQLSEEHDEVHQKILDLSDNSQKYHEQMIELYDQLNNPDNSSNELHEQYMEARQAADQCHQRIVNFYKEIKLYQYLYDLLDDELSSRRHEKAVQRKEEKIEKSKKKRKAGEKMTLDELRLVMGVTEEGEEEKEDS
jgi:uncharacterized coiled-coil DUF342 family protein